MLTTGTRLREYEVWGRIGGGGMSDVFLARHVDLSAPVIVKTLKLSVDSDARERAGRLRTEAVITARIRSHRVVRPLDVGTTDEGTPYLVQQYVDGLDLLELDASRRRALGVGLPLWYVCEVTAQMAGALAAAHRTGVLHRDLKPSNLFVSPEEGVQLGDFGVAVARGEKVGQPIELAGTLEYMAPETLRGGVFDRGTDVYGLGATAFQLRYGRAPYASMRDVLDPSMQPNFPRPESPEEAYFQQAVAQMLEQNVQDRWNDMSQVVSAFTRLADLVRRPLHVSRLPDGFQVMGVKVTTRTGDLAAASADAAVCSANSEFTMDVGVGAALVKRGGRAIEDEAKAGGAKPLGACISTGAGTLPFKRVLHAVAAWEEVSCVARSAQRALLLAEAEGLKTLAVPAIGTGAARVSLESSAASLAATLELHLRLGGTKLTHVDFILYDETRRRAFAEVLESVFLGGGYAHDIGRVDSGVFSPDDSTVLRK
ncbi:MAG: serine/threonine-protein kinase [Myxococcaceae bacterium]|nr:serine/threonine-protein kinase [Myxococcaceae bacterium]